MRCELQHFLGNALRSSPEDQADAPALLKHTHHLIHAPLLLAFGIACGQHHLAKLGREAFVIIWKCLEAPLGR